jgi:hypothetical protein
LPAVFAASSICWIAQEPRYMVATLPVAISVLEPSHAVVVGSFSLRPSCTTSNSRPSEMPRYEFVPVHGVFIALMALFWFLSPVTLGSPFHCDRGHWSL